MKDVERSVDSGILRCRGEDDIVTFTTDDVTYALDYVPSSDLKDYGWHKVEDIVADDPESSYQELELDDVEHDGRTTCAAG